MLPTGTTKVLLDVVLDADNGESVHVEVANAPAELERGAGKRRLR